MGTNNRPGLRGSNQSLAVVRDGDAVEAARDTRIERFAGDFLREPLAGLDALPQVHVTEDATTDEVLGGERRGGSYDNSGGVCR